jgi:hypothetical protein
VRNSLLIALVAVPFLLAAGFWNPPEDFTSYDSAHWIDSGLEHERHGEFSTAERDLLQAANVDHLFQPRWTLAGFYFRRENRESFMHWAREALAVGQRDLDPLFDLCWKLPDGCPSLLNLSIPDPKPVGRQYLFYLMSTARWQVAAGVAEAIANQAEATDKPLLMNYCDLALEHSDKAGALAVWNQLCRRKLLPFPPDRLVPNGDFRAGPSAHGFDWRVAPPGIANPFRTGESSFTLSGFQSEREVLLEQPLVINPALNYVLEFEYKTSGLDSNSGVHWTVGRFHSEGLASEAWKGGRLDFAGPADSLLLVYQRPGGSSLAEGSISVRNVSVVVR